ncbi:MAG: transcription antitermination factor NusB [Coriobacteriia bacterium]
MLERTRARRQALQILYQREITGQDVRSILDTRSYNDEDGEPSEYSRELALGTEVNQAAIDSEIETTSQHWSLMRMPFVDRNILRLAVFEIIYEDGVPASVAINEAVELAKAYGGDDSPKFVNGVLGKIAEMRGDAVALDLDEIEPPADEDEMPSDEGTDGEGV